MTSDGTRRLGATVATLATVVTVLALAAAPTAQAQTTATNAARGPARTLSIDDALRLAESGSEAVRIARAGVTRARGQLLQARSQYLPQLNGTAAYTRTLQTQFSVLQADPAPEPPPGTPPVPPRDTTTTFYQPCTRYLAAAGATQEQRLAGLEAYTSCQNSAGTGGIDFQRVGFGAPNQFSFGATGSVNLFTGGRVQAQNRVAQATQRAADVELTAQRAQIALDVTQAYFDVVLASRLVAIAESSLVQTESVLRTTRLARQVGNQSEFDLLRAQVTRDNQVPALLQQRTTRDLALLRLKQLLDMPATDSLVLTTELQDADALPVVRLTGGDVAAASGTSDPTRADTSTDRRAAVRQADEAVRVQEALLRATRAERLPSLVLSSAYSRVAFPSSFPTWNSFLPNWTVSVGASVPLYTGGRLRGDQLVAEANLAEARARREQVREFAALDAQQSLAELANAEAAWRASAGTAEQAARAYTIADVRFREGLSTQVELSDSRILLQQAQANRALAARNLQVARVRLALLRDLPLQAGGQSAAQAGAAAQGAGGAAGTGAGARAGGQGNQQGGGTFTSAQSGGATP
jgi:outer membrane protein TolC